MLRFPEERKLRIEGCATKGDLANPAEFDSEGQRWHVVGKDGNTTDLTVGRYAGLVSFTLNEVGIESVELGIYDSGAKTPMPFPLRETRAPSSSIQRTAKFTSLPTPLWKYQRWLDQQPCHLLHPWLVHP